MFNMGYKKRQIEPGVDDQQQQKFIVKQSTSRCKLRTLAGAAVVVSVLGAELGASVGEAAGASCCATEAFGVKAGFGGREQKRTAKNFSKLKKKRLRCGRFY